MLALSASPQHPAEGDCTHWGGLIELPKEAGFPCLMTLCILWLSWGFSSDSHQHVKGHVLSEVREAMGVALGKGSSR